MPVIIFYPQNQTIDERAEWIATCTDINSNSVEEAYYRMLEEWPIPVNDCTTAENVHDCEFYFTDDSGDLWQVQYTIIADNDTHFIVYPGERPKC